MFRDSKIEEVVISDTSNITDMHDMFYRAPKYTGAGNISDWDVSKVTTIVDPLYGG